MTKECQEFTGFTIDKIDDDGVWIMYTDKGRKIYREPLAASFRLHLDDVDEFERAMHKFKLSKRVEQEILKA